MPVPGKSKSVKISIPRSVRSSNRPKRIVPTDRLEKTKQFDLIRAYAIASGPDRRPVTNEDVARVANLAAFTVSVNNAFFMDCGFIRRSEAGFVVADEVHDFNRVYSWAKETAGTKLAPLLRDTWFGQSLLPRLKFKEMSYSDAVSRLADDSGASADYKTQIGLLLEYLCFCGLITITNGVVKLAPEDYQSPIADNGNQDLSPTESDIEPLEQSPRTPAPNQRSSQAPSSSANSISFSIQVDVDVGEISTWDPQRISAFFSGIAQVLAAKKGSEE